MDFLERLVEQGFSLRSFPTYARHLGVEKYNCAALLELTPEGQWRQFSSSGYLIEGQIALLVERNSSRSFVYKAQTLLAEGAVWDDFCRFREELAALLDTPSGKP